MDLGSSRWVGVWSNVGVAAEEIVFLRQSVIASWSGGGGGRRVSGEDRNTNTTAGGKTGDVSSRLVALFRVTQKLCKSSATGHHSTGITAMLNGCRGCRDGCLFRWNGGVVGCDCVTVFAV